MKKIVYGLSFTALALFGCSNLEKGVVGPDNSTAKGAYNNSDIVHVIVCKKDKTMWRFQGSGYEQQFQNVQGIAKSVSIGHHTLFHFDPAEPEIHGNTGESWHIGADANYNGTPWRLEVNNGWVPYFVTINSTNLSALDVTAHIGWRYNEHYVMITTNQTINGNNVYKLNGTSWEPLQNGLIIARRIDVDQNNSPWCVTNTGKVYRYIGYWERMDNGAFQASDIGCGYSNGGIYVTTTEGLVYNYVDGNWNPVTQFNNLNVEAYKIDAAVSTAAVSTTSGDLYYIFNYGNGSYGIKKANITNVNDVSIKISPAS